MYLFTYSASLSNNFILSFFVLHLRPYIIIFLVWYSFYTILHVLCNFCLINFLLVFFFKLLELVSSFFITGEQSLRLKKIHLLLLYSLVFISDYITMYDGIAYMFACVYTQVILYISY